MNGCVVSLIVIFIIIIILMITGFCCCYKNDIDQFAGNIYSEWKTNLENMKLTNQIGDPPGILKFNKDAEDCSSKQNLLVQHNVAFLPVDSSLGCSYVEKVWPSR